MNVTNIIHKSTYTLPFTAKDTSKQSLIDNALTIGDYASQIYVRDGKSYALVKTGKKVFDGTGNWAINKTNTNTISFYLVPNIGIDTADRLCNYFKCCSWSTPDYLGDKDIEGCWSYTTSYGLQILKSRLSTVDVAGFKAWLAAQYSAGNPVAVSYVLATPIEIEIEPLPNMQTFYPYTKINSSEDGVPIAITAEVRELGNRARITAKIIDENGNYLVNENGNYICGLY